MTDIVIILTFFGIIAVSLTAAITRMNTERNRWMKRRGEVIALRKSMLDRILYASLQNLHSPCGWRYIAYNSVSLDEMMNSGKPLTPESFYSDLSFLKP